MPVLLGPQPVGKASSGQLHIVVGQDLVLGHVVEELAAFDQPLGKVPLTAHLFGVHRLAVRHVHPILVEELAGFEVALGDRAYLNRRTGGLETSLATSRESPWRSPRWTARS